MQILKLVGGLPAILLAATMFAPAHAYEEGPVTGAGTIGVRSSIAATCR